ncbi:MAG: hypothetical protein ACI3X1_05035 [Eubacteriales bacterium]
MPYKVAIIGEQEIRNPRLLERKLTKVVKYYILHHKSVTFYVGANPAIDIAALHAVKAAKEMTQKDNCQIIAFLPDNLKDMEYTKIPFDGFEYISNISDNPWEVPYGMASALACASDVTVCYGDNPLSRYKQIATLSERTVYV